MGHCPDPNPNACKLFCHILFSPLYMVLCVFVSLYVLEFQGQIQELKTEVLQSLH